MLYKVFQDVPEKYFYMNGFQEGGLAENYVDRIVGNQKYSITYLGLEVDSAIKIQVAPIVSNELCDISATKILTEC